MDALGGWIPLLARTAFCSTLAAGCAWLLLTRLRLVASPRVHRLAYLLVVVQGWLFVPWTLRIELPFDATNAAPIQSDEQMATASGPEVAYASVVASSNPIERQAPSRWVGTWMFACWLTGAFVVLIRCAAGYLTVLHRLPVGRTPANTDWQREWDRVVRQSGIRKPAQLRITSDTGPLLCFVPFAYLVLVPNFLWSQLRSPEREAILRHELAHLARGDLWKSIAIRIIALPQWFNPCIWWAVSKFDEAAEWACDDLATKSTDNGTAAYARALLRTAEVSFTPVPGSVAAQGGVLSRRITRLVKPGFKEEWVMNKFLVTMLLLCLTLAQLIRIETVTGQDSLASITPDAKTNSDALSTTEVEPTQRQADLKRTGLAPYRLEPPDIITIGVAAAGSNVPNGVGGQHLVGPDGTVRLGEYGSIFVTGMTLAEAQDAIQAKLSDVLDDPQVALGLFARNSKCVYVVSEIGTGPNFVLRVPCNIDTNVKDVLSHAVTKHPVSLSQVKIWVQRHSDGKPQQLHVDWESVAKQKHHPTNHLLLPGDRVFVATEELSSAPKPAVAATPPPEYLIPDAPRHIPTALQQTPTDANDEPRIQVQITVVKDRKGNLAEFEPLRESGFLLADTVSTRGTLRTLEKNCLIEVIASPAVQCTSGTTANVIIGDHLSPPWRRLAADFERLREAGHIPPDRQLPKPANQVRVEVTPSIHEDSQIHLQAKTEVTTRGEMVRVESELMVTPGKTVILRQKEAPGEAKEKENDGAVYLVLTPSLVR